MLLDKASHTASAVNAMQQYDGTIAIICKSLTGITSDPICLFGSAPLLSGLVI